MDVDVEAPTHAAGCPCLVRMELWLQSGDALAGAGTEAALGDVYGAAPLATATVGLEPFWHARDGSALDPKAAVGFRAKVGPRGGGQGPARRGVPMCVSACPGDGRPTFKPCDPPRAVAPGRARSGRAGAPAGAVERGGSVPVRAGSQLD